MSECDSNGKNTNETPEPAHWRHDADEIMAMLARVDERLAGGKKPPDGRLGFTAIRLARRGADVHSLDAATIRASDVFYPEMVTDAGPEAQGVATTVLLEGERVAAETTVVPVVGHEALQHA